MDVDMFTYIFGLLNYYRNVSTWQRYNSYLEKIKLV